MTAEELVKLGEELDKVGVPYKFNIDDDYFVDAPSENVKMASQNVPYMLGTCDSEMGFLLPSFMQLGDKKMPREQLIGIIAKFIGASPKCATLEESVIKKIAEGAFAAMESIYGKHSPFDSTDEEFPRYCYLKALADQFFMGGYLRALENCETNKVYCYSMNIQSSKNHYAGSPVPDWVNADHADDLM